MVELQPVHTTIVSEGTRIIVTIYNRPSYGEEWVRGVLADEFAGVTVHRLERIGYGATNHFAVVIPSTDMNSKFIRGKVGRLIDAASAREGVPHFEDPRTAEVPEHLKRR